MELNWGRRVCLFVAVLTVVCCGAQLDASAVRDGLRSQDSTSYDPRAGAGQPTGEDKTTSQKPLKRSTRRGAQSHMLRSFWQRKRVHDHEPVQEQGPAPHSYDSRRVEVETQIPVEQTKDFVQKLPGQPKASFAQYAGYITVNETAGRAFFYWFVEAASNPETKPLILWLNGGPGCSSVGYGAAEEIGPFRVTSDGATLVNNQYSWNKLTNIIFLESPAGVGFSYSNTSSDYYTNGDAKTASDNLAFLIRWFERFPQYKHREFYLTGESYAGHYVPQLAQKLYRYNNGQTNPAINLKGYMVGNAIIDTVEDNRGTMDYWWTHALISDETYAKLRPCVKYILNPQYNSECYTTVYAAYAEQGNIDPYDIYTPSCLHPMSSSVKSRIGKGGPGFKGYDPCVDNFVFDYFNRPDVQLALHANVTSVSYPWEACSDIVNESWQDWADSVIPIYRELIAAGLRITVFSGDVDSVVPVTATKYSLKLLKLNTTVPWYPWYLDNQVGGYTQGYAGLTFVTVRNSGHEVPLFQPARAFSLITSFLSGKPLPTL